jgi:hypothetical protein
MVLSLLIRIMTKWALGGYNNAASHGGVIKSDLYVSIGYYDNGERNVILQLETE